MKIDFENLGCIDKGSIELNDFTIFCGKNNSGKTYAMYSVYGLLNRSLNINFDFVKPIVDKLKQEGSYCLDVAEIIAEHKGEMIKHIEEQFKGYLPFLFGVIEREFLNTKIKLVFFDDELQKRGINRNIKSSRVGIIMGNRWELSFRAENGKIQLALNNPEVMDIVLQSNISEQLIDIILLDWEPGAFKRPFLLPAERAGINLFFKELLSIRNLLLQQSQNYGADPSLLLKDVLNARYAVPIKDYVQYLGDIGSLNESRSDYRGYAEIIQKNVLNGKYEVDNVGNIFFVPFNDKSILALHFSSSTVKTLFGLVFYLKHLAKKDDYLMIDEPELNLHPDNQRQVARILAQLVNAGLKVVVSTHSNYFIREINNLIMLKNEFKGVEKLRKKYKYQPYELLDSKRVSAYLFDNNQITAMQIDEEGIIAETFDTVTDALNQSSDDIYYAMQAAKEKDD